MRPLLAGVRVLAAVTNIPGPVAAARLAELGAHVTKIEPLGGDPLEPVAPAWYAQLTRDMEVVRLDLKCSQATLLSRLAQCDLLITAMRTRSAVAAGLHWEEVHARFPRLSQIAIVGEASPNDDRAGHDLTYQARAHLLSPPALPRTVFADLFAAERAAAAAILALYALANGTEGSRTEIAIADGALALASAERYGLTGSGGPLGGAFAGYALYRTSDGWIALAALEKHFQERLRSVLQVESLERSALEVLFARHTCAYWEKLAESEDLPLAAVR